MRDLIANQFRNGQINSHRIPPQNQTGHQLHKAPKNSNLPTGYSSKVSLATNLGRINSLKQFHKNKINTSSRDQLQNPQYLSISNLKDNPKGSNPNHHGFRKKKLGNSRLIHSRSKDEQNFYSNVISPLPDIKDNAELLSLIHI